MKREQSWTNRLLQGMELGGESMPLQPVLELCGDRRVLIENHFGVSEYSLERIRVEVRFGQIMICGSNLQLRKMQGQMLVIAGKIDTICVKRGRR